MTNQPHPNPPRFAPVLALPIVVLPAAKGVRIVRTPGGVFAGTTFREALVRSGELPPPRHISKGRSDWLWRELHELAESRPVSDAALGPGQRKPHSEQPAP